MPAATIGVPRATGQKSGSVSRAVRSPTGRVSRICRRYGLMTRIPETVVALPAMAAFAPTMSRMRKTAGDCITGFASRLNASAKLVAVTGAPVWKRKVRFRKNVYVLASGETV